MATGSLENHESKKITAKDRNRAKLLKYLSDPENDFIPRQDYSTQILKYKKPNQIYQTLPPEELTEIEAEAMESRKAASARQRSILYSKLYEEGKAGNVTAIKEFLDRTEGKVKEKHEHDVNVNADQILEALQAGRNRVANDG